MQTNDHQAAENVSTPQTEQFPAPASGNQLWQKLIIGALGLALLLVVVIIVMQIMETKFYSMPPSVWPRKCAEITAAESQTPAAQSAEPVETARPTQ